MKAILIMALLGLSQIASASYFQESCSNGDSSVRLEQGHGANVILLSQYENQTLVPVEYDPSEIDTRVLQSRELSKSSTQQCDKNVSAGFSTWKEVKYQKVKLTRRNGSLFPKSTYGVSLDRKSVVAEVIWEENGNSMMFCGSQN